MKYVVTLLISIGIAFYAGFYTHKNIAVKGEPEMFLVDKTPTDIQKPSLNTAESVEPIQLNMPSRSDNNAEQEPALSTQALFEKVQGYIDVSPEQMSFSELVAFYNLVDDLSEDDLLSLLDIYMARDLESDSLAITTMFNKYLELNQRAALDFAAYEVANQEMQMRLVGVALMAMAKDNAVAALDYIQQFENSNWSSDKAQSFHSIFLGLTLNELAKQNLPLAADKLKQFEQSGRDIMSLVGGIARSLTDKQQFADFLFMTENIDNKQVADTIIRTWTHSNAEEASDWLVNQYQGDRSEELRETLISSWAFRDAKSAANWVLATSTRDNLTAEVKDLVRAWSYDDPEEALDWFSRQDEAIYNQGSFKEFITGASYNHPDFAAKYLSYLSDDASKASVSVRIYNSFKRQSDSKAQAFLDSSPYKDKIIERARN
ncbi:hypothetical protein KJ365_15915 [Glaciecola sp. XM2]|uniref:hypothetical protein n=1 Tax=Glaciecola sp. XM2 TaxID=1914931 RepID=UPI001BDEA8C7|nr:hypothetical protein [Glaciecola sp. XM2]MBT1452369.1 hypothetical protein [Glaciecola sp. XM2]